MFANFVVIVIWILSHRPGRESKLLKNPLSESNLAGGIFILDQGGSLILVQGGKFAWRTGSTRTGFSTHNTTSKFIQSIRTICLFARNSGLINHDPFANYRISFEKVDRGYLLDDEIKMIINKEFATERLSNVRDIFIFSCFTGLAYIDVANLTCDNLVENDGRFWIMTKRQKTKVTSNILLLDIPLKIIEKYKGKTNNNRLMPILSNQKMNSYLKEIANICQINKNLTYHLARHTFATTITLSKGVPIETVSKMLGHTNIKSTQLYARITNEKIEKDMLSLANQLGDYSSI